MKIDQHKIESLVNPIVEAMGYTVWHIELLRVQRKVLLRIYIDVPPGVSNGSAKLDDCGLISKQIGAVFDVEEPIAESYILEVSSPGLNRSLFKLEHYQRYIGQVVNIVLRQPINGRHDFIGKIKEVVDNRLKLVVDEQVIDIDITDIGKAKLTVM